MRNVRAHRGADVRSNHHLLITNIKLKLRQTKKSSKTILSRRFDAEKVQHVAKKNEFILKLKTNLTALRTLEKRSKIHGTILKQPTAVLLKKFWDTKATIR